VGPRASVEDVEKRKFYMTSCNLIVYINLHIFQEFAPHGPFPRIDTILYVIRGCHVQKKVLKLLMAYVALGGVSLSGEEPDITSLSMLPFLHKTQR
jgi:hypothetical protein